MPQLTEVGKYTLTATLAEWTETQKGILCLAIDGVDADGGTITAYLYFSDKSEERSKAVLRDCFGVTLGSEANYIAAPDKIKGQKYNATCEIEEYDGKKRLKVKWINPVGRKPIAETESRSIFARQVALDRARGIRPAGPTAPVSQPRRPAAPPPPVNNDDDIPF
jgi:hypothetical protein